MPIQQIDNTRVTSSPKPTGSYTHYDPKAPKLGVIQDTGTITEDNSNPVRKAIQNYTASYLNSNFANSPFMDVMRWLPGFSYIERVATGQPVEENESLSMVMPMKGRYKRDNKINIDDYRDELEDVGIYFKQNKPVYKDPIRETYEARPILKKWGEDYFKNNKKFLNKTALNLDINYRQPGEYLYKWDSTPDKKILWNNYVSSMDRRRHDYFFPGFRIGNYTPYVYMDETSKAPSAIFGFNNDGIFTPSHFAPFGLKSGYKMITDLANEPRPVLFSVPEDLSKQLEKVGYTKIWSAPQPFGNKTVNKNMMVNRYFAVEDFPKDAVISETGESLQKTLINSGLPLTKRNGRHYFSNNPITGYEGIIILE